jgi:glycolate oxidase iron-sulfur subunit
MDAGLISDCVHCGFCLPTCPTYELWHEEMDSPRGRNWLIKATVEEKIALDPTVAEHFDLPRLHGVLPPCPSGAVRLAHRSRESGG